MGSRAIVKEFGGDAFLPHRICIFDGGVAGACSVVARGYCAEPWAYVFWRTIDDAKADDGKPFVVIGFYQLKSAMSHLDKCAKAASLRAFYP